MTTSSSLYLDLPNVYKRASRALFNKQSSHSKCPTLKYKFNRMASEEQASLVLRRDSEHAARSLCLSAVHGDRFITVTTARPIAAEEVRTRKRVRAK